MNNKQTIFQTFCRYVSMNVLSMIGLSCYILADTYFVSSGVGSMGVAALNIVLPVYSLISAVGLMIGIGSATRYSVLIGAGNNQEANRCFTLSVITGVVLGLIFTFIGIFFSGPLVELLGADLDTRLLAEKYIITILSFSCAFILNQIFICFVRNDQQPNLAMIAMLVGSFSNVILDYIFIFPLQMGMFGAAFATGLSPIFSMMILSAHYFKKYHHFHFVRCPIQLTSIFNFLMLGLSAFITEFSSGIIMMILNFIILNLAGNIGVAAYGIIANLALVIVAVFTGIAQGIQPLISANYGLKNYRNIQNILIYATILSLIFGLFFCILGNLIPHQITAIFNKEGNLELAGIAVQGIRLYFTAFLMMGFNIVTAAFFAAMSLPLKASIISITRGCAAVIPLAFVLSSLFQMKGIWLTIPCAEAVTLIISFLFLTTLNNNKFFNNYFSFRQKD